MFSNLPRLFFPLLGRVTQTAAQGVKLHFLPSKNQREVWQKKRGKLGRLFDMQWAWQNDSIRTSNDNLPAVRSLPKSITEGENKLKVVMASGVLSQAINLSFVNTLVRRKKKPCACTELRSPAGNRPRLIRLWCFSMQIKEICSIVMAVVAVVKDTDCRASEEFGLCSYEYFRLRMHSTA